MPFILAMDQGTTSSRAIVFDETGAKRSQAQIALPQIFPQAGWVEHDPEVLWGQQLQVARDAIEQAGIAASDLAAVGVTNQRETVVVWDRATGVPIHNAIVWQDRRTAETCDALVAAGHDALVRERTGLGIDPYFSAAKIGWLLDHVDGARARAEAGELAAGTIDTWLIWKLSGGAVHVTDSTNASRTQLLDIATGKWDEELAAVFGVPLALMPRVARSSEVVGSTAADVLGAAVPIGGVCGDQQAALVGNGGFGAGDAKATFGTGIFALMHTGGVRAHSTTLAATLAAQTGDELQYALEGSIFMGGAVIQWLVEGLELADSPQAVQALAESVPDSNGVVFVPALTGLGAPEWDPYARGAIFGLTRGAKAAHIARAGMEAIPLQVSDLIGAMAADSGHSIAALRVDGGVTVNELVMQILADVLRIPVDRALVAESTALGAAYLAGLAVGVFGGPEDLPVLRAVSKTFEPDPAQEPRLADLRVRWAEAVKRSKRWEHD
jgi:glycerol kinase